VEILKAQPWVLKYYTMEVPLGPQLLYYRDTLRSSSTVL
jgi:hypothetical protein